MNVSESCRGALLCVLVQATVILLRTGAGEFVVLDKAQGAVVLVLVKRFTGNR